MADGIVNLQTDLKSLRYGSMPLGSDKPYVTKDVNNPPSSNLTGMEITKRIDDTSRIAQMLIDRPGLKYLFHEAELKQIGVGDRIAKARKGGKSVVGAVLGQLGSTAVGVFKIAASTLAQVPVNGTGTHFIKEFRTDTYLQPSGGNNRSAFAQFFGAGGVEGAPLALEGSPIEGVVESNFGVTAEEGTVFYNTLESKYDYFGQGDAKAKKDNENPNKTLSEEDLGSNNISLAKEGKPITIPSAQHWDTTVQPTELGRSTTIDKGELKAFDPYIYKNTYSEDVDYNKAITPEGQASKITSTPFVQGSVPISGTVATQSDKGLDLPETNYTSDSNYNKAITPEGQASKITSTPFVQGSIPISGTLGTLPDNSADGTQVYSANKTYTGKSTEDNIASATTGRRIATNRLSGSYRPSGFADDFQPSYQPFEDPMPISALDETDEAPDPTAEIVDFRANSLSTYSYDYKSIVVNKEKRVGLGNQGKDKVKTSYMTVDPESLDSVNMLDVSTTNPDGVKASRDLAKFYFEIITPDTSRYIHFRAFIDSIDDGYTADWGSHKYVGRAENFYTYGGFDRDITVSFKIAAATRSEMKPLYKKMVLLASTTAPTYAGTYSKFMRGTIAKLTIGSYFAQIPGVITSVKYSLIDGGPWEIAMGNPDGGAGSRTDDDQQELPTMLQCSVTFKPIHNFAPQTGLYNYFTSPTPLNGSAPFFKPGDLV